MQISITSTLVSTGVVALSFWTVTQQQRARPQDTEVWEPVPAVVTPGATNSAPPSDAIVLFDGTTLDQWVSTADKSNAQSTVADGVMTVNKRAGNIETKRSFKNYQLHLEWRIPENITGTDQARGVFHNGVLIQHHVELKGETLYIGTPSYRKYDAAPIKLQAHGDPSPAISFRNIWVRELPRS